MTVTMIYLQIIKLWMKSRWNHQPWQTSSMQQKAYQGRLLNLILPVRVTFQPLFNSIIRVSTIFICILCKILNIYIFWTRRPEEHFGPLNGKAGVSFKFIYIRILSFSKFFTWHTRWYINFGLLNARRLSESLYFNHHTFNK